MKLQDQVCTLEQAKKLKKLGVEQKSLFAHINGKHSSANILLPENIHSMDLEEERFSAFTVAELGVMLPKVIKKDGMKYRFRANRESNGLWHLKIRTLSPEGKMLPLCITQNLNEAEARADMLIKLLEKELITVQWINDLLK